MRHRLLAPVGAALQVRGQRAPGEQVLQAVRHVRGQGGPPAPLGPHEVELPVPHVVLQFGAVLDLADLARAAIAHLGLRRKHSGHWIHSDFTQNHKGNRIILVVSLKTFRNSTQNYKLTGISLKREYIGGLVKNIPVVLELHSEPQNQQKN